MKRTFHRDLLEELNIPDDALSTELYDQGRWINTYRAIFGYEGKFWEVFYFVGCTENQESDPWQNQVEIPAKEAWLAEVTEMAWVTY